MQLSTKQKLQVLSERGIECTTVYLSDFLDTVFASKTSAKQTFTITVDAELLDAEIEVMQSVADDVMQQALSAESTLISSSGIYNALIQQNNEQANELYTDVVILNGCPYATRGLSQAEFA